MHKPENVDQISRRNNDNNVKCKPANDVCRARDV